jgi:hypothetical protein
MWAMSEVPRYIHPAFIETFNAQRGPNSYTVEQHVAAFWASVEPAANGCIVWVSSRDKYGYGKHGKGSAHRAAYKIVHGSIPDGLTLDHLCRNTSCVNPDHLEPVTLAENRRRAEVLRTHCKSGHEFNAENTYVTPAGARQCRACNREAVARYKAARRQRVRP